MTVMIGATPNGRSVMLGPPESVIGTLRATVETLARWAMSWRMNPLAIRGNARDDST